MASLKIHNGDSPYGGPNKSSYKRSRPSSPRAPTDSVVKGIKTRTRETRKLSEFSREISSLEDANTQAQARRLMLKDHVFPEHGKITLLKVFRRKPDVAAGYADIRSGLSDAARRAWI